MEAWMDSVDAPAAVVHDSDFASYLDAICATMRCEPVSKETYRCSIPVLVLEVEATDNQEDICRFHLENQVVAWAVRQVARGETLPAVNGLQPQIKDVVVPDIFTEHLRLVPFTATLSVVARCNCAALEAHVGVRIDEAWPEGITTFDTEADPSEQNVFDLLPAVSALQNPASAPWKWMIVHRADNVLIGSIGTTTPPTDAPGEDSIQISYHLVPSYRRCGYMTEAARAYVAWAFTQPHLSWIYAMTESDNVASRRVLEKVGARPIKDGDGCTDWLDWEILPEYVGQATSHDTKQDGQHLT
jgi:RimJ/RimL family protein N-acetyltransferase